MTAVSSLALIGNLSLGETIVIAVIAILIFGRNLPEVAARVFSHLRRLRRAVDDLRRETGIDRELRSLGRDLSDATREMAIDTRQARRAPRPPVAPPVAPVPVPDAEPPEASEAPASTEEPAPEPDAESRPSERE